MTHQQQKDYSKLVHTGAMEFTATSTNKGGFSASGINQNLVERLTKTAEKVGASVTVLKSEGDGNTYERLTIEITDPLASRIESFKQGN